MSDQALDHIDRAIISELEQDGRRAFREIGRSLDISEATVRARYRRLVESGLIRIVAFADPSANGRSRLAQLLLRVEPARHDEVVARLCGYPEVSYVSTLLGRADIFAQVLVADDRALWEFVQGKVRSLPGVTDTECVPEVTVHKLWFDAPVAELQP